MRRFKAISFMLILGSISLFLFQNCTGPVAFGNGAGYEGVKPTPPDTQPSAGEAKVYVASMGVTCPDGDPALRIEVEPTGQAVLNRKACTPVNPPRAVQVEMSVELAGPPVIVYQNAILTSVNNPEVRLFCRGPAGEIKIIGRPDGLKQADVIYMSPVTNQIAGTSAVLAQATANSTPNVLVFVEFSNSRTFEIRYDIQAKTASAFFDTNPAYPIFRLLDLPCLGAP